MAALASYLDARAQGGKWLLRIDDLDPPREQAGATRQIMQSLQAHGLHWDGDPVYQSRRHARYAEVIAQLQGLGRLFPCQCSRRDLAAQDGHHPPSCSFSGGEYALRIQVDDADITFTDRMAGECTRNLMHTTGPFVVQRRDGLYAYHLACVVDDADAGVSDVVRGDDLLGETFAQIHLQRCLGLPQPRYCHIPVLRNAEGQKLSKQSGAAALDDSDAIANLRFCLRLLLPTAPLPALHDPKELLLRATEAWAATL